MPTETELKLTLPVAAVAAFLQHPIIQAAENDKQNQRLYNCYFDTPDNALAAEKIALRIRHNGETKIQTVKTAGKIVGGIYQRKEWEDEVDSDSPDYSKIPKKVLTQWRKAGIKLKTIEEAFITDFTRSTWDYTHIDNSHIEIALDQGVIHNKYGQVDISEIELELKSGTISALYETALQLLEELPLMVDSRSKAARGYRLNPEMPIQYYKAAPTQLNTAMNAEQAFSTIVSRCLTHLQMNEEMVLYGNDIEGVHQMRVALRRLRSCLTLYKSVIPRKAHAELNEKIKYIANCLGEARDWDVFRENLMLMQQHIPNNDALIQLDKHISVLQADAYVKVRTLLRSSSYTQLILELGLWISTQAWQSSLSKQAKKTLRAPAKKLANTLLQKQYQRVINYAAGHENFTDEQRHELRILIKKMGYGSKFFAELYPRKKVRPYTKTLSALQDELGVLNDVSVAADLLQQAGIDKEAAAHQIFTGWYAHQHLTHLSHFDAVWHAWIAHPTFWKE